MLHALIDRTIEQLGQFEELLQEEKERWQDKLHILQDALGSNTVDLRNIEENKDSKKDYFSPGSSKKTNLIHSLKMKEAELDREIAEVKDKLAGVEDERESVFGLQKDLELYRNKHLIFTEEEHTKTDTDGKETEDDLDEEVVISRKKVYNIKSILAKSYECIYDKTKLCEGLAGQDARRVKLELERMEQEIQKLDACREEIDRLLARNQ